MATKWLRTTFEKRKKKKFEFLHIAYGPVLDGSSINCFFTNDLHLPFRSYVDKKFKGEYKLQHPATRQCHYCENYFAISKNEFVKHVKRCYSIEGIIYSFDYNKIISFQDNFGHLGDILFTVYFDFETSTGDNAFQDQKVLLISYYQIYAFHPTLNLDKIVISRSFQQSAEEIYDLNHFRQEHFPYFDRVTFNQLKDAATSVLAREKSTSLSQLFSVELKFTVDILNKWFKHAIQSKSLELNDILKNKHLEKKTPLIPQKQHTASVVSGLT